MKKISTKRKLYCRQGITDILMGKGEYLLHKNKKLFLTEDDKQQIILFKSISFKQLGNIELVLSGFDCPKTLYLISL